MSLKKKIVLVFLFATLVPVVIGTVFVSKKTTTQVLKSREKVIDLADHDVKDLIKTVTDDVGTMLLVLSDIYLKKDEYLKGHGTEPSDESRRSHLIHHMSNFSSMNINTSEFILGIPGELPIYNVDYRTEAFRAGLPDDYNVVERPWYQGAIKTNGIYISRPFLHARTKKPVVTLSLAIKQEEEVKGVLLSVLNFDNLSKKLENYRIGDNGSFFIIDRNYDILLDGGKNLKNLSYISDIDLFSKHPASEHFEYNIETPDGVKFFHTSYIKELDLLLIGEVDLEDSFSNLYEMRNTLGTIIFLTILIVGFALYLLVKSFNNSLGRVGLMIDNISSGNYNSDHHERIEASSEKNEFKFIADGMLKMNEKIIKREMDLRYIAETDPLTKIYNRRAIINFIKEEITLTNNSEKHYCLLMFDLDKFKRLNDNFGHLFGDEVLKSVTKVVGDNIRTLDSLGRYGGEEFLLVLSNTKLEEGILIANRLIKLVENLKWKEDVVVTMSMGVIQGLPKDNLDTALARVDHLLYKAKDGGRNRVEAQKIM